jgi:hypothetical protein
LSNSCQQIVKKLSKVVKAVKNCQKKCQKVVKKFSTPGKSKKNLILHYSCNGAIVEKV